MAEEVLLALELERVVRSVEVPPIPVFRILMTRVGSQVQMEPAFIDLVDLRIIVEQTKMGAGGDGENGKHRLRCHVGERYLLDLETLVHLKDSVNQILATMPGYLEAEPSGKEAR